MTQEQFQLVLAAIFEQLKEIAIDEPLYVGIEIMDGCHSVSEFAQKHLPELYARLKANNQI